MTSHEILETLRLNGSEQTKKILLKHGAKEPLFGVKIDMLKKILKGEKGNNALAMELFSSGNYDAMYLAGLMADGARMTPDEIGKWAAVSYGGSISEYTVPWVASENKEGCRLALEWIDSPDENIAVTGWSAYSSIVSVWPDAELDPEHLRSLLQRVAAEIHQAPNHVRLAMNGFIISAGSYVGPLKDYALEIARKTGPVKAEMYGTACRVPTAADYIMKAGKMGKTGQKKKTAKC